jgi:hypothetical protein
MLAHNRIIALLVGLSLSSSLASCDSSKNPSKENFARVINESIKDANMCLYPTFYPKRFDADELAQKNNSEFKASIALERMGLLSSKEVEYTPQYSQSDSRFAFAYILGSKKQIGREFTLTEKGQKYSSKPGKESALCYAHGAEISKIMHFTEPADKDGERITNVTYTYKYKNIDEWAKDPAVMDQASLLKESLNKKDSPYDPFGETQVTRTFKLTNEGWMLVGRATY